MNRWSDDHRRVACTESEQCSGVRDVPSIERVRMVENHDIVHQKHVGVHPGTEPNVATGNQDAVRAQRLVNSHEVPCSPRRETRSRRTRNARPRQLSDGQRAVFSQRGHHLR